MSQISRFNKLKQCRHGLMLFNQHDRYIGRSLDLYGEYSEGELALFDQLVREGQVVLDVGANIGAHALFLARKVGLEGTVHAFEPQRLVFQTLCANMALNSLANVRCYHAALGSERGEITVPFFSPWTQEFNWGGVELGAHAEGEKVPLLVIDELSLPLCHFIKIDVEGMELEVVRGAQDTIRRCRPLLYIENDRSDKAASLIHCLAELGYNLYWHRPLLFNQQNFAANPTNIFADIASHNMLCLPRELPCQLEGFQQVELPPAS